MKHFKIILAIMLILSLFSSLVSCDISDTTDNTDNSTSETEGNSLSKIEKWYRDQMPAVCQNFHDYASSVSGISSINVTNSRFLFGEDSGWYDCHYTLYFTCKVNGAQCTGEARAFMKHKSSDITWFHFEIFNNSNYTSIIEHYDESYDQIIEDYYKSLASAN